MMKFMRTAIRGFSVGAALALSVTAVSADGYTGVKAGPYDRPFSWTGFYLGAGVGYSAGTSELTPGTTDISLQGAQGVVSAGYDVQVSPNVVLGVLVDYAFGDVDGDLFPLRFTISNQWAVGARAGFLATARSLWYANAGWTRADFDLTVPGFTLVDKSLNGFFVGGGVEQALSRNVSLKLEYRFSDYENFNFGGIKFDNTVHSVRLGVNYKF